MITILVTGATGTVGQSLIKHLVATKPDVQVLAGVRDPQTKDAFLAQHQVEAIHFDFAEVDSMERALERCDKLFLLRPPQLADTKKYFEPLIQLAIKKRLEHIVFLSVQGAEKNTFIPHHKIERLIIESGIPYTLLRPAYFMQNFTTTLRRDIVKEDKIYLPAGNAKFSLIDVADIGNAAATVLLNTDKHQQKAYELTNQVPLSFPEMANILSEVLQRKITFKSPSLIAFLITKSRAGTPLMLTLVMIMLHYLPRFQKEPKTTTHLADITGQMGNSFRAFATANQSLLSAD